MVGNNSEFIIKRSFDACRELVFSAWTEAERLAQWWGLQGFSVTVHQLDFHQGGIFHYSMHNFYGSTIWGKFVYQEVIIPERLVFITTFSNEKGDITRHPFNPDWPLSMLSTVLFSEDHDGRTTLTITWLPLNPTEVEYKAFEEGRDLMQLGWTGTLDKLADYLAKTCAVEEKKWRDIQSIT